MIRSFPQNNLESSSPEGLWVSMKAGSLSSLQALYDFFVDTLYNYGAKFTDDGDLVKDCIQELFVSLWTRKAFLSNPKNVRNYLLKSIRLSIFKKVAKDRLTERLDDPESYRFQVDLSAEENLIHNEDNKILNDLIAKSILMLTPRQREVIFLKFYEHLSYVEIAEIMGVSVKNTYKIMNRALASLKDHIKIKNNIFVFIVLVMRCL